MKQVAKSYTIEEGGLWLEANTSFYTKEDLNLQVSQGQKPRLPCETHFHSIQFEDGKIWDEVNGWRK